MVFYGEPRSAFHVHDAGSAMKIALGLLAFGTFTTWLMVGPFSRLLQASLPFHELEALPLGALVSEIVGAPATWVAVGVIGMGMVLGLLRERFGALTAPLEPLARFAEDGLGFELINAHVVSDVNLSASGLRALHTGQLSWNVVGIIGGLIVLIAALVWVV
jgi:NADH-quinone oxidoreductase subunit L